MTVRVATVLSARDWEPDLVACAREQASVRIVLRAFRPSEIAERSADIDVVVAGADVSWVTPGMIASWRRLGLAVVGIHPPGDRPAAELLATGGVDERLSDDVPPESIIAAVQFVVPHDPGVAAATVGTAMAVVGGRGAPGCTEIALSLAWLQGGRHRTVLVDMDLTAPSLAVRLGVPPRPDLTDAADAIRSGAGLPPKAVRRVGKLDVIVGSHRPGEPPLGDTLAGDVLEGCLTLYERVVVDLGLAETDSALLKRADQGVVVVDGSAVGIVRAAELLASWAGPPPRLVVNRVTGRDRAQVVEAVRHWTGLEPSVLLPWRSSVRESSLRARHPDRRLVRALEAVT